MFRGIPGGNGGGPGHLSQEEASAVHNGTRAHAPGVVWHLGCPGSWDGLAPASVYLVFILRFSAPGLGARLGSGGGLAQIISESFVSTKYFMAPFVTPCDMM